MTQIDHTPSATPAQADPVADPGFPEHEPRLTDVDAKAERRAELQIAGLFVTAGLLFIGFCVAYFAIDQYEIWRGRNLQNLVLGLTFGGGLLLIGIGAILWARKLMDDHEQIEMRHPAASPPEDRAEVLEALNAANRESGFGRRPLIRNTMLGSLALLGLPSVVFLRDLGPSPYGHTETVWGEGVRVVNDVAGTPLRPSDIEVGQLVNAQPAVFYDGQGFPERSDPTNANLPDGDPNQFLPAAYHGHEVLHHKAKAAVVVVRMRPEDITPEAGKEDWGVDGILCYSKICTHLGCPISLWEQQTHHLLCPCHQSTYDLADNGKVVFGPAFRPLPQLPLKVDADGYLVAQSDFLDIVSASYPEIARDQRDLDERNGR